MRHVLILGGGAIGSAVAAFLSADPKWTGRITVVERDASYALASSARSAASIRQQFSTPLNIAMSQFGLSYLRSLDGALGLSEQGYLYLATTQGEAALRQQQALQREMGADILLMSPDEMHARWPWLHTQDLTLGCWGRTGEGWFDGWALLQHFRQKALAQGVRYLQAEVSTLLRDADTGALEGVQLAPTDGSSAPDHAPQAST